MKKIDRRKALKNLTIGIGGATLLSNPLSGFATTKTNSKTIPSTKIGNPNIENPVTAITLGAGNRGNVYGNYGIEFSKELDIIGVAEPISIRKERYAKKHNIEVPKDKLDSPPYSMDANLLHTSYEGGILEDPWKTPEESMWLRTKSIEKAANKADILELEFKDGDIIKVNKKALSPFKVLKKLNDLAGKHGIGRIDIVENRYVGIKSRGCYETPGGTIYHKSHKAMEYITIDRELLQLKEDLSNRYTRLIYNGYWFSPERESLQKLINDSQKRVTGTVRIKILKGNVMVLGRKSPFSIYSEDLSTFETDSGNYDQRDAEGFIKVNSLRLRNRQK